MHNEKMLEAFRVPKLYKIFIWGMATVIVGTGIWLSTIYEDWLWLARAGAVIVVIAMALEATGFVQKIIDKTSDITKEIMFDTVLMQVKRRHYLYGITDGMPEEHINKIAEKELKRRVSEMSTLYEKTMLIDLRKTEFSVAALGTLLWAFSDLINKL